MPISIRPRKPAEHTCAPRSSGTTPGGDIVLPGDSSKVIRVADNPELEQLRGTTLITSDGTTLLGADDKAGVAIIMELAAYLIRASGSAPRTGADPLHVR